VAGTGIQYNRLERGILHFFSSQADFDSGAAAAELMRQYGVDRRVLNRDEVLKVEPALPAFGNNIHGGTFTPSDESGDACVFTQKLAQALHRARRELPLRARHPGAAARGPRHRAPSRSPMCAPANARP